MKHFTFFNNSSKTALPIVALVMMLFSLGIGDAWSTSYISYEDETPGDSTTISAENVSSGSAGEISWTGTSCSYSSSRVNIAASGSITFSATSGYVITKIVITSGSGSADYYGTWTSSPSVTPSSSSGVTTFDGLRSSSVTVTTSTAFRCTSKSDIKIYYSSNLFKETWNSCSSTGGNDGQWSGTIASGALNTDNSGWTNVNGAGANKCAKFGTGSNKGSAETPAITYSGSNTLTLTFKAAAWNYSSEQTTLNLSATNATLDKSSVTLTKGEWNTYTVILSSVSTGFKVKWEGKNASNSRFFLDEVIIKENIPSCTELAPLNGSVSFSDPTTAVLTWNKLSNVAASDPYAISYRTGSDDYGTTNVGDVDLTGAKATCTITGLSCNTDYDFKIAVTAASGYCDTDTVLEDKNSGKWTITKASVSGGSFTVKESSTAVTSACSGSTISIAATPSDGYSFGGWTITKATSGTVTPSDASATSTSFTMPSDGVTVTPTFTCVTPTITVDPADAEYAVDVTATALGVTASAAGASLSYQWQSSSDNSAWSNIAAKDGGTGSTYTPSTASEGTMYYRVIVTNAASGCSGSATSGAATITVSAPTQCETPTFSVSAGTYHGSQSVELACETAGATIYYTTNGNPPTSSSTAYSSAITVDETTTIKAIAIKDGLLDSEVASAEYTIQYQLTWSANGGDDLTGSYTSGWTNYGATVTAPNTPTRTGYSFDGWHNGTSVVTPVTTMPKSNITYTAQWSINSYKVSVVSVENVTISATTPSAAEGSYNTATYNTTVTLSYSSVTSGYTWGGWRVYKDGDPSTTVTVTNNTFTMPAYDVKVTAFVFGDMIAWCDTFYYFTGQNATSTTWNTAANWKNGEVPDIDKDVVLLVPAEVDVTTAQAKSIVIDQSSGNTGSITIPAGKALVVAGTVKKTTDGETLSATEVADLHIGSSSTGNGSLVMGSHDGTNKAQVDFYTKARKTAENNWVNQYIGTPFSKGQGVKEDYYGSYLYSFDFDTQSWVNIKDEDYHFTPFLGYNIIRKDADAATLEMQGKLVATTNQSLTLRYDKDNAHNENVLANSWTAPIKINAFVAGDFTNSTASIYIFNAGGDADAKAGGTAGNYSTYSIGTAEDGDVIPSMQSFSVYATAAAPSLTLNYARLVYNPAVAGIAVQPNYAPRRMKAAAVSEEMQPIRLRVSGESGYADELKIYLHEDFSDAFENGWDAHKMYGYPETPQLYAVTDDGELAILCAPDADATLLGFKAGEADTEYTFTFRYDSDEPLFLLDMQNNTYTEVQTGNAYTFQTSDVGAHNRFVLTRFAPQTPTDLEPTSDSSLKGREAATKHIIDNRIYILLRGVLYDATGRRVEGVRE